MRHLELELLNLAFRSLLQSQQIGNLCLEIIDPDIGRLEVCDPCIALCGQSRDKAQLPVPFSPRGGKLIVEFGNLKGQIRGSSALQTQSIAQSQDLPFQIFQLCVFLGDIYVKFIEHHPLPLDGLLQHKLHHRKDRQHKHQDQQ